MAGRGKPGRPSAAELQATLTVIQGGFGERPEPPDDLNPVQKEIWKAVVSSEPVEFFASTVLQAMLADYCRHREAADMVSGIIAQFQPEWLKSEKAAKRYQVLLNMRDKETNACARLATKLRLTNQARYTPQAAATAAKHAAPAAEPWAFK